MDSTLEEVLEWLVYVQAEREYERRQSKIYGRMREIKGMAETPVDLDCAPDKKDSTKPHSELQRP